MKTNQIFIGDIRKCTKYETHNTFSSSAYIDDTCIGCDSFGYIDEENEIYKENAVLIKIENGVYQDGVYVDLEKYHSIFDYIKIYQDIINHDLGGLIMSTSAYYVGNLFVDEKSLKPYYTDNQQAENISVRQLKKQIKTTR